MFKMDVIKKFRNTKEREDRITNIEFMRSSVNVEGYVRFYWDCISIQLDKIQRYGSKMSRKQLKEERERLEHYVGLYLEARIARSLADIYRPEED